MGRRNRGNDDSSNGFAEWGGYMAAKRAKLLDQFKTTTANQIEKISDIFNGIAILVNGLTNPSADELKLLMAAHGGVYHMYQVSSTTHIIASNLPNVKIKHLGTTPIVKPSWITDSISLGKLLDYKRYLLYTNQSSTQPRLDFPVVEKPISPTKKIQENPQPTKTASDPKFLEEFYNNSRLHLISTLGAEFKQLVVQMRDKSDGIFLGREKLIELNKHLNRNNLLPNSVIMHIDMDCFFVSVGLKNHPELRGKPVAVTHARNGQTNFNRPEQKSVREAEFALYNGRLPEGVQSRVNHIDENSSMSEIASCSYEARKCGIKNGMFLGTAVKLCPELKTIPYDFQGYKDVSNILYKTVASYTLDIEAVSCDEMYVDVTQILKLTNLTVDEWATHIRNEIMTITGCPCSTGFGSNRLQARLATRKAKPAGQFYLQAGDVEIYMSEIPLADLPGVGRATLAKLQNLGLQTCGDVQITSLKVLQNEIGLKNGETLMEQAKGIDRRPLNFYHERKSVSAEVNYGIRFKSIEECYDFFERLSNEVFGRLVETGMRAKCLTLKLMVRAAEAPLETAKFLGHGFCDNISKSTTLTVAINDSQTIFKEVKIIYEKLNVNFSDLRGIGIQLSKLEKNVTRVNSVMSKFLQKKTEDRKMELPEEPVTTIKEEVVKKNSVKVNAKPGPSKSKRGRTKGGPKNQRVVPSKNGILQNFVKTKPFINYENFKEVTKNEIDLNVLKELPEDLQQEIIESYQLEEIKPQPPKTEPVKNIIKSKSNESKKSPFSNLTWDQIKPIIKNWIEFESAPLEFDTIMLAEHFKELAINRKIEVLQIVFNFLHRIFSELNCDWHQAYYKIVDITQQGMVARYGGTLMVNRKFKCCEM